ncbi:hypothetical protein [Sinorhizobium alkalisoli]|uniref:hypothetical protein n=1 Tax=Sinorhizobium alkalisoli TaxID=1752398 RepID=UPI001042076D|nr:hypothetical protein [Sinorhizobium alkalisoli]
MSTTSFHPTLNSVASVKATSEVGVFILRCNITDMDGNTYNADYCSRPEDGFGLNLTIRQWFADNPFFPVQGHAPAPFEGTCAILPFGAGPTDGIATACTGNADKPLSISATEGDYDAGRDEELRKSNKAHRPYSKD